MAFKPMVKTVGDEKFYGNALVFETKEEALASASHLMGRWMAVVEYKAEEVAQPVQHKWVGNHVVDLPVKLLKAENGVPFLCRVVLPGDKYGLNDCLVCGPEELVEFYDARYMHTIYGQFISRYYASTLLHAKRRGQGLNLDGRVPVWQIDAQTMQIFEKFIEANLPKEA